MNFIGRMEGQEIQVELKYCERCGGLWLRPQGAGGVYCSSCSLRLAAMPDPGEAPPRSERARRRARKQRRSLASEGLHNQAWIDCLQGVATMEVWA
jgi:Zn-finger nucleic acid-binding protein